MQKLHKLKNVFDHFFLLKNIYSKLKGKSPNFVSSIVKELLFYGNNKCTVVSIDAGYSVLFWIYALKELALDAFWVAMESDYDSYLNLRKELNSWGLSDSVKLIYAPIVSYEIDGEEYRWNEVKELKGVLKRRKIDYLIFGSYLDKGSNCYVGFKVLRRELSEECMIFVEDGNGEGKIECVKEIEEEKGIYEKERFEGGLSIKFVQVREEPYFSVCIPTYNRVKSLKEAIDSVLSQTYKRFELVVYDDGSTDGTRELVRSYRDERVKYYGNKENRGRPYARNRCIELARGDWIVWLDDDDLLDRELLTKYVVAIGKFNPDVLYPKKVLCVSDNGERELMLIEDFYLRNSYLKRFLVRVAPIPQSSACLRKSLYSKFGLYREEFLRAEDHEFWSRVLPFVRLKAVEGVGLIYRFGTRSISARMNHLEDDITYESVIKREFVGRLGLEEVYEFVEGERVYSYFAKDLLMHLDFFNALFYLWLGGRREEFEDLLQKSGLVLDGKRKRLEKKFYLFLKNRDYVNALEIGKKLSPFHAYLSGALVSYYSERDFEFIPLVSRAVLINPLFDYESYFDERALRDIEVMKDRVLRSVNDYEVEKDEFVKFFMEKSKN